MVKGVPASVSSSPDTCSLSLSFILPVQLPTQIPLIFQTLVSSFNIQTTLIELHTKTWCAEKKRNLLEKTNCGSSYTMPTVSFRKRVLCIIYMCATKVQYTPFLQECSEVKVVNNKYPPKKRVL